MDRSRTAKLSVVIPAFNEEGGIGPTLRDLADGVPGAEIIVIDDGSSDRTAEIVLEFPGVVLAQHPFNRGYGAALKTGMSLASRELVAWFDADHEHRVADLVAMTELIERDRPAIVIAQRRSSGPSPMRNAGKFVIGLLARSLEFKGGKDINCGLRVFQREVITRYLDLLPNGFSASITSTMIMLERGYPILYHPIEVDRRIGQSKVKVSDGFRAMILVLRTIMLFAPMRIFLRLGMILFLAGAVYGIVMALIAGRGLPAVAVILMIIGVVSGFFGLIADQISQMRLAMYDRPIYRIVSAARPGTGG
jgi:glycosyltransferase involved in cell wall biosynthesis